MVGKIRVSPHAQRESVRLRISFHSVIYKPKLDLDRKYEKCPPLPDAPVKTAKLSRIRVSDTPPLIHLTQGCKILRP